MALVVKSIYHKSTETFINMKFLHPLFQSIIQTIMETFRIDNDNKSLVIIEFDFTHKYVYFYVLCIINNCDGKVLVSCRVCNLI
jgi:hypothetical protein